MAILRYWCPKHHTSRTSTVPDKFISAEQAAVYGYGMLRCAVGFVTYKKITPVCPICREKMVYAGSQMPKKTRKKAKRK